MDNKKFCTVIARVNNHKTSYRLKLSDGSKLELDKAEIGNFIPQLGMSVQLNLFNSVILQEVLLDGLIILKRSPEQLLKLFEREVKNLEKADNEHQKICQIEASEQYQRLPIALKHRLQMLKMILKKQFTAEVMQKELNFSTLADFLSQQTTLFIKIFERDRVCLSEFSSLIEKMKDFEIADVKFLALCLQKDAKRKFKTIRDFECSEVLKFGALCEHNPFQPKEAIRRYVAMALAG